MGSVRPDDGYRLVTCSLYGSKLLGVILHFHGVGAGLMDDVPD